MLAGMMQLTRLQLRTDNPDTWEGAPYVSEQTHSLAAITQSSKLQHLQLTMELPVGLTRSGQQFCTPICTCLTYTHWT